MGGFFRKADLLTPRTRIPTIPRCGACGLFRNCSSPKMPVYGEGVRKILIVGEAPGKTEDQVGRQFVGKTGQLLRSALEGFDIDMDRDCWTTNALICWPHEHGRNRTPTAKEIDHCRPNLIKTIEQLRPEVIIPLGAPAVRSLIGWLWKEDVGSVGRWIGWNIPSQKLNAWICPAWHPSYIAREERSRDLVEIIWKSHLEKALVLSGRPWKVLPNYENKVEVILDPSKAAQRITDMQRGSEFAAFDYETDRLKPDHSDAHIYCCSISNGSETIAYPWHGEAIRATQTFLRSKVPKIASNAKFEERWTLKEFGHGVRNWDWDTMLAAHVIDNRPDITSIKFQAFVMLGVDSWDDKIKPYLKAKSSNESNRIREVDLTKVLVYCGLDSLLEWEVAKRQKELIKEKWNACDH